MQFTILAAQVTLVVVLAIYEEAWPLVVKVECYDAWPQEMTWARLDDESEERELLEFHENCELGWGAHEFYVEMARYSWVQPVAVDNEFYHDSPWSYENYTVDVPK